jgi:hypothetical protein
MSHNPTVPRYQPTYRADEIRLILRYARRGESLCFMGIAGAGKSNLVNFLRDIHENAEHVEASVEDLHFPVVDAAYWQQTPASLWQMMLDGLSQATRDLGPTPEHGRVIPITSREERALSWLQARLEWLCQELKHQVMFVLDDFDAIFETGPLTMLERLNALRSEGNRGCLSYLVFTKRLPPVLGQSHNLDQSKFYDLFRHNIYALEPYTHEDARQMLAHLNDVAGKPLTNRELAQIQALAGGHARLLKVVFDTWSNEGAPQGDPVTYFAARPDVQQECQRIFAGLHEEEQQAALGTAGGQHAANHRDMLDHLSRRGLLSDSGAWFSPLFRQFLATYGK